MTTGGLVNRRPSTKGLTPLIIPRPSVSIVPQRRCPTPQEVEEEGKELMENFIFQNIRNQRIETPEEIQPPQDYQNPLWASTGRELRLLADRFAQTRERQQVKKKADSVDPEQLNWDEFRSLMTGIFEGGITKERIVVLFVFCSDLAIRSLQAGVGNFRRLLSWCLRFLQERVCTWVQARGGWKNVISSSTATLSKAFMVLGAFIVISVVVKKVFIK